MSEITFFAMIVTAFHQHYPPFLKNTYDVLRIEKIEFITLREGVYQIKCRKV
jgi:hypothetical protein